MFRCHKALAARCGHGLYATEQIHLEITDAYPCALQVLLVACIQGVIIEVLPLRPGGEVHLRHSVRPLNLQLRASALDGEAGDPVVRVLGQSPLQDAFQFRSRHQSLCEPALLLSQRSAQDDLALVLACLRGAEGHRNLHIGTNVGRRE